MTTTQANIPKKPEKLSEASTSSDTASRLCECSGNTGIGGRDWNCPEKLKVSSKLIENVMRLIGAEMLGADTWPIDSCDSCTLENVKLTSAEASCSDCALRYDSVKLNGDSECTELKYIDIIVLAAVGSADGS